RSHSSHSSHYSGSTDSPAPSTKTEKQPNPTRESTSSTTVPRSKSVDDVETTAANPLLGKWIGTVQGENVTLDFSQSYAYDCRIEFVYADQSFKGFCDGLENKTGKIQLTVD